MRRAVALSLSLSLAFVGACSDPAPTGPVFIALQSDFADFRSWTRTFLGDGEVDGHATAPRYGYVKERPPSGTSEYPIGALVVKAVEQGTTLQEWDVIAMVKRGGSYNKSGALNWEYFVLVLNENEVPVIYSRGDNPNEGDHDGGPGHGYADPSGSGVTCNRCHGLPSAAATDYILSPALAPGN